MNRKNARGFKTLQGRLFLLLLLPVFLIIFSGGVVSFLVTRNMVLEQWNESALLKLQRAAHYMEMRMMAPVKVVETLLQVDSGDSVSLSGISTHLSRVEGVSDVSVRAMGAVPAGRNTRDMARHGMMRFRHSRITDISDPVFDSDLGHETITLTLTLVDSLGWPSGEINLKMSFDYLLKDIIALGWWQSDMACIVDQNGRYMAHTNMAMKGRHVLGGEDDPLELAVVENMQRFPSGTVNLKGHPPEMVAGFQRLAHVSWTIILFARGEKLFAPIIAYRNLFGAASLVLISAVLFLIRRHVGQIVSQIKALSDNAGLVSQGEYGAPVPPGSRDEIGQLVVNYNEMVNGLKQRDFIRDTFGRYVDPEFAKSLLEHPRTGRLGGDRREVVVLMSDIRGFTPLAEALSPEVTIRILNHYFSHMIRIIQDHSGIIVDFFGDAILVFFDPLSGDVCDKALSAVRCAAEMQARMDAVNQMMDEENLDRLSMGIGINLGPVVVGNIGSETRAKYGVVGSAVNIANRIQAQAQENEILVSAPVFECVEAGVDIGRTFSAQLKGVDTPATLRAIRQVS